MAAKQGERNTKHMLRGVVNRLNAPMEEKDNMACPFHEGKHKIMVCVPCNIAVCDLCIELSHNGHHPLHSAQTAAKSVLQRVINDFKTLCVSPSFITLKKYFKDLSDIRETEEKQAVLTKQELLDRRDKIKDILDEVTETALTKLDQHYENLFRELDDAREKARQQCQKYIDLKDEIERLKASANHLEFVERGWKIKYPDINPLEFPKVSRLKFVFDVPGEANSIEKLFGELAQQDLNTSTLTEVNPDSALSSHELGDYDINLSSSIDTLHLFGEGPQDTPYTQPTYSTDLSTQLKLPQNT